jgi:uncharacterized cupin superfamily protein
MALINGWKRNCATCVALLVFVEAGSVGSGEPNDKVATSSASTAGESDASSRWLVVDRLFTDAEGHSYWAKARIPQQPEDQANSSTTVPSHSIALVSNSITIWRLPDKYRIEPTAPESRLVFVLSGRLEVTASNGDKRSFGSGDFFIATDEVGPAHHGYVAEGPLKLLLLALDKKIDLNEWTVERTESSRGKPTT